MGRTFFDRETEDVRALSAGDGLPREPQPRFEICDLLQQDNVRASRNRREPGIGRPDHFGRRLAMDGADRHAGAVRLSQPEVRHTRPSGLRQSGCRVDCQSRGRQP